MILDIDESAYANDDEMLRIIHRLQAAAADAKMRHDMNVEDEYFSVIEKRDTTIMLKDKEIAEKSVKLEEQKIQLEQKDIQIHTSVQMLHKAGMSPENIASSLGMGIEKVKRILASQGCSDRV